MSGAESEFPELVEAIVEQRCVLFLGPDISASAAGYRGLPTTWQLADKLAERCNYRGHYQPLPRMAQIYVQQFDRPALVDFLRAQLQSTAQQPLPIHHVIAHIPFRSVIHAGWDRLLEDALVQRRVQPHVVYRASEVPYQQPDQSLTIFKPYGSLDRSDQLRITEQDQLALLDGAESILPDLKADLRRFTLLLVGYALDYDWVFTQLFYEIRRAQGEHRPPAYVVQSLDRADDANVWTAQAIRPIVADPARFLYDLAHQVAHIQGRTLDLPPLTDLSSATRATIEDLRHHASLMNRVMDNLGIDELVERSDVPLLRPDQVQTLETMRAAYERLAPHIADTPEAASMWLRQGNIEYVRGNCAKAEELYRRALAAEGHSAEAYHNLHYVHLVQEAEARAEGDHDAADTALTAAWTAYEHAVALDPSLALAPPDITLHGIIGQGGIGVVYRGVLGNSSDPVAVKVLKRSYLYNQEAVRRFQREARLLQSLDSPHIVRLHDLRQHGDHTLIVMEYLGEQNLEHVLRTEGPLTLDRALSIAQQVGAALQVAHDQKIVHRDIKPANLFLVGDTVKVIDFGLAADLAAGDPSMIGQATGTLRYMAPEQQQGRPIDARADQYALATVVYEMMSGRTPDEGSYRPLSELIPGINPAFDLVIETARDHDPRERYESIAAFCNELLTVGRAQPASQQSGRWLRLLARLQQVIDHVSHTYWYLTLPLMWGVGVILPAVLPSLVLRIAFRYLGLLLWVLVVMNLLMRQYQVFLSDRRVRARFAAQRPLVSLLVSLGVLLALLIPDPIAHARAGTLAEYPLMRAELDGITYTVYLLIFLVLAVVLGGLSLLTISSMTRLEQWLRKGNTSSLRAAYAAILVLFLAVGYIFYTLLT